MKRVLITGAGGFVGTHLVHALQKQTEYEIFAAVYKSTSDITALIPADHIQEGDLTDYVFAQSLIQVASPDLVFHLAALSAVEKNDAQAVKIMTANTILQFNLLEAIRTHQPKARMIAICSGNAYGLVEDGAQPITESTPLRPLNAYAVSKITQEMLSLQYHLAYGLDVVILRPFNHTGPGQTDNFVIPALAKQFAEIAKGTRTPTLEIGNLETIRDYTDVADMVQAYILAAEKGESGEIYNIGTGKGVSVRELIDKLKKITGIEATVTVKEEIVRHTDVPALVCDATKFRTISDWKPQIPLETTLQNVYNYWKEK
jgi:GDP-4-dehydro-6-deoxy-D-mannose reductase